MPLHPLKWSICILICLIGITQPLSARTSSDASKGNDMSYEILQQRSDRMVVALPNRMIIVAQELHAAPVVSAQVWVNTGSIYEQEHVGAGLSHFLEHLLAGGSTTHRTEKQSNELLGKIGARTNAATGLDTVHYFIDSTSQHTQAVISLLSDWMQNAKIEPTEYQRERQVIQREFEHGMGSPGRIFWKLTQQARYTTHPARHPTIGYLDTFLSVTRDEIYDFYRRMYVPNNMIFVVAGDIDKQQVIDQIVGLWQDQPPRPLPTLAFPQEPAPDKPRQVQGHASIHHPRLRLAWPGTRLGGPHDYALDLLGIVLGQGESSRLVRTVRDDQRLVNTISSYNASFNWGKGFFAIDCELATPHATDDAIEPVKKAILDQVHQLLQTGVTSEELARAKRKTLANIAYQGQTAHALASELAQNISSMADPDYQTRYVKAIEQLTAEQVLDAAKTILVDQRLIEVRLVPQKPGQKPQPLNRPEEDQTTHTQETSRHTQPIDLDNKTRIQTIAKRYRNRHDRTAPIVIQPITQLTLSNGLRVLIQPSNLVPTVSIQMYQTGGLLSDPPGQEGLSNAVASMLTRGTRQLTAEQLASKLDNLGAYLSSHCGNNTTYTRAACLKQDLPAVMDLFAQVVLEPRFDATQWKKLKPRLLARIDRQTDTWQGELQTQFRKAYFGTKYPWGSSIVGHKNVVDKLTAAQLSARYHETLCAKQSVLAIFGDVQVDQVRKLAAHYFTAMPADAKTPFILPTQPQPAQGIRLFQTQKPLAAVQIGMGPGVTHAHRDFPTLSVISRVISDFPSGWLEAQLRGNGPGLAYAVWAYQVSGLAKGYLAVGFNTQPQTVQQALTRTAQVLDRMKAGHIDPNDLQRAKAAVLASELMNKQSNPDRAAEAALNLLYGLGLDHAEQFIHQVNALTASDLKQAANRYMRHPLIVVISPEKTKLTFGSASTSEADAATSKPASASHDPDPTTTQPAMP